MAKITLERSIKEIMNANPLVAGVTILSLGLGGGGAGASMLLQAQVRSVVEAVVAPELSKIDDKLDKLVASNTETRVTYAPRVELVREISRLDARVDRVEDRLERLEK